MKVSDPPVVVEQVFNKPVEEVWKAITDRDQMVQWFFDNIPEFKATKGFSTQFNVQAPSRDFMHLWKVVEVIPLQKIVINWKYEDCKGDSYVIMEVEDMGATTRFTLTTQVIEDFNEDYPEFKRESCVAGWDYFIKENLSSFLEK